MSKANLKINWATHEAASFACQNWHYSKCVPAGKLVKVGVWEDGKFIGVVLFGRGANARMAKHYGLNHDQACELVRVALTDHINKVTKIIKFAFKFLRLKCSKLKLIVSYADPSQGHHGGIYQAGNWIYSGRSQAQSDVLINGKLIHKKSANAKYGTASPEKIMQKYNVIAKYGPRTWKHIYLMPLDKGMKKQIMPLSKPYPKRASSDTDDTLGNPAKKGQFDSDRCALSDKDQ